MDTNDRVITDTHDRGVADAQGKSALANVISWLALILSIIALVLAWMAYDNSNEDNLSEMIQEELRGSSQVEEQSQDATNTTPNDDATAPSPGTGTTGGDTMNDDAPTTSDDATTVPEGDTTTPQQ